MSTFTLEQKRLEQLRRQLYGKQSTLPQQKNTKKDAKATEKETSKLTSHHTPSAIPSEDYIKKDLFKVAVLSVVALLFQFLLYTAITNNWVNLTSYGITF